jgi:hypothetical protein
MPREPRDSQRRGMQLSKDFPHARREQYLVALPGVLLSLEETWTVIAVLETLPPNPSEEDFVLALAVALSPGASQRRWRGGPLARR